MTKENDKRDRAIAKAEYDMYHRELFLLQTEKGGVWGDKETRDRWNELCEKMQLAKIRMSY
jgi:N-methylhydantoinase B/oxoprolinase/acetone carboxylase alpha subunit